jgi:hypothetical protein
MPTKENRTVENGRLEIERLCGIANDRVRQLEQEIEHLRVIAAEVEQLRRAVERMRKECVAAPASLFDAALLIVPPVPTRKANACERY